MARYTGPRLRKVRALGAALPGLAAKLVARPTHESVLVEVAAPLVVEHYATRI